jgi:hypothetical protein
VLQPAASPPWRNRFLSGNILTETAPTRSLAARARQVPGRDAASALRQCPPSRTLRRAAVALAEAGRKPRRRRFQPRRRCFVSSARPTRRPNRLVTGVRQTRADAVSVRHTPEAWFSARRPRRREPDGPSPQGANEQERERHGDLTNEVQTELDDSTTPEMENVVGHY